MRTIQTEQLTTVVDGRPALVTVPVIPADAGQALREGLRRRRVGGALGRCPCGARRPDLTAVQDAAAATDTAWVPTPHTGDCPAHDDQLGPQIEAWQQNGARRGSQAR